MWGSGRGGKGRCKEEGKEVWGVWKEVCEIVYGVRVGKCVGGGKRDGGGVRRKVRGDVGI